MLQDIYLRGRKWKNLHTSDHVKLNYCFALMLGHRLRRWPNMKPAVGQLLVFNWQRIRIGIQIWITSIGIVTKPVYIHGQGEATGTMEQRTQ